MFFLTKSYISKILFKKKKIICFNHVIGNWTWLFLGVIRARLTVIFKSVSTLKNTFKCFWIKIKCLANFKKHFWKSGKTLEVIFRESLDRCFLKKNTSIFLKYSKNAHFVHTYLLFNVYLFIYLFIDLDVFCKYFLKF